MNLRGEFGGEEAEGEGCKRYPENPKHSVLRGRWVGAKVSENTGEILQRGVVVGCSPVMGQHLQGRISVGPVCQTRESDNEEWAFCPF